LKNKVRSVCDLILGILFIVTVIWGYYTDISYMGEYCFISGMLVGIFFLISFFHYIMTRKELSVLWYFNCMLPILIILIVTLAIGLNVEGAFIFIHIINPIVLFAYWCVFCNHCEIKNPLRIATVVIFPICYFVLAFVLWKTLGKCPFPANLILVDNSLGMVLLSVGCVVVLLLVLGYVLHFLNKLVYHKLSKYC